MERRRVGCGMCRGHVVAMGEEGVSAKLAAARSDAIYVQEGLHKPQDGQSLHANSCEEHAHGASSCKQQHPYWSDLGSLWQKVVRKRTFRRSQLRFPVRNFTKEAAGKMAEGLEHGESSQ